MNFIIAVAVSAGLTGVVSAQTTRDLDSHVHGAASLNIALDDDLLFIEIDTPWNNLVGFEHEPRTDEQKKSIDDALVQLSQPDSLFSFEGADCESSDILIEQSSDSDAQDENHKAEHEDEHKDEHADTHKDDHHDSHKDEHDDEHHDKHDDTHKDEHDEDHHDHEENGESHSSVRVSYSFTCDSLNRLSSIEVHLMQVWPGFEELDVQLIGPGGQTAAELRPQATRLDITAIQ